MGWRPPLDGVSLWHFNASWDAWQKFHCKSEGPKAPTSDEFDQAVREAMNV